MTEETRERKQMDYWELSRLLENTAKAIEKMPNSILRNVEPNVGEAINEMESTAKKLNAYVAAFDKVVEKAETELWEKIDAHYDRVSKKIREVNEKIERLPKIKEPQTIPYKVNDLIKTAEGLAYMDDKTFERLIQILTVFVEKQPE